MVAKDPGDTNQRYRGCSRASISLKTGERENSGVRRFRCTSALRQASGEDHTVFNTASPVLNNFAYDSYLGKKCATEFKDAGK